MPCEVSASFRRGSGRLSSLRLSASLPKWFLKYAAWVGFKEREPELHGVPRDGVPRRHRNASRQRFEAIHVVLREADGDLLREGVAIG